MNFENIDSEYILINKGNSGNFLKKIDLNAALSLCELSEKPRVFTRRRNMNRKNIIWFKKQINISELNEYFPSIKEINKQENFYEIKKKTRRNRSKSSCMAHRKRHEKCPEDCFNRIENILFEKV
jgi:formylmethanofuran dehydrogenase subunit A